MDRQARARTHQRWLRLLAALFVVRVVAQPLSLVAAAPFLPPFDAWHSGALPYAVLVASQVAIVVALFSTLHRMPAVTPRRSTGILILAAGSVYLVGMLARLVLGGTAFSDHPWFDRPLPTVFHLVLASFLIVYGHFHVRYGQSQ